MAEFLKEIYSWISFVPKITIKNFLEIAIIAIVIYEVLVWIKNTRAWTLLKGILFILAFFLFAAVMELDTILWLLEKISYIAVTAILIIFQPELRKALEQLGSRNVLTSLFSQEDGKESEAFTEKTIHELVRASFEMGKVKTGALMVIERTTKLNEIERTGIQVDGIVTSQLLINIFEHNTPLHDGAVVIRGQPRVTCLCRIIWRSARIWAPGTARRWESANRRTALPSWFLRRRAVFPWPWADNCAGCRMRRSCAGFSL